MVWGNFDDLPKVRRLLNSPAKAGATPTTLSLWNNLDPVYSFAYRGIHLEALQKRKEWFQTPEWPTYVAWWVGDDERPTLEEAARRLEHLHDNGPTPEAFTFKQPFDSEGKPMVPVISK